MKPSIEAATKLAAALKVSLDYLAGIGEMQAFDKGLLLRVEELASLLEQGQQGILFALDGLLWDAKLVWLLSMKSPRNLQRLF